MLYSSLSKLLKERVTFPFPLFFFFPSSLSYFLSFYKQSSLCAFPKSSGVGAVSLENINEMFHLVRGAQY